MTRKIEELIPKELLALAIQSERDNKKVLQNFARMFEGYDKDVARKFEELAREEVEHEVILLTKFAEMFGGSVPKISQFDVEEVLEAMDFDDSEHLIFDSLKAQQIYRLALEAENRAQSFYWKAMKVVKDKELVGLFEHLAKMENEHGGWIEKKLKNMEKIK